uniref:Uncharacterized protein n=1 Tax=Pararge aegeria TaxID=116150 RepID=S4PJM2_9NEOP
MSLNVYSNRYHLSLLTKCTKDVYCSLSVDECLVILDSVCFCCPKKLSMQLFNIRNAFTHNFVWQLKYISSINRL